MSRKRPPTPKALSQKCKGVISSFNKKKCILSADMKQVVGCLAVKYRIEGKPQPLKSAWKTVKSKECGGGNPRSKRKKNNPGNPGSEIKVGDKVKVMGGLMSYHKAYKGDIGTVTKKHGMEYWIKMPDGKEIWTWNVEKVKNNPGNPGHSYRPRINVGKPPYDNVKDDKVRLKKVGKPDPIKGQLYREYDDPYTRHRMDFRKYLIMGTNIYKSPTGIEVPEEDVIIMNN